MIKESFIRDLIETKLNNSTLFLVDVKVKAGNKITVLADSKKGITIDECANISKFIESNLNRDVEDYELEVSSPGISQPMKVEKQYQKVIGKQIQVLLKDGTKKIGKLLNVNEEGFQIEEKTKIKGKTELNISKILFNQTKETKLIITFNK